jgi:hypothetical protein
VVVVRELVTRLFPLEGQSPKLTPQALRNRPNRSLTTDYARLSGLRLKNAAGTGSLLGPQSGGRAPDSSRRLRGTNPGSMSAFCVSRGSGSVAPDLRVTTLALCIDPPFAKLIPGSWFAKVVVMSERSTEQIRELLRSNLMTSPRAGANQNFESEEHTCQRFVSRDLVFLWTVLAQG